MTCALCESGLLCEVHDCLCAVVKVGGEPTGSRNWNPDCPVHPWNEALQAQADRAVALQREARKARRERPITYEYEVVLRVTHREIPNPDMPSLNVNALAEAIVEGVNLDGVGAGQDIAIEVKATWFHGEAKRP